MWYIFRTVVGTVSDKKWWKKEFFSGFNNFNLTKKGTLHSRTTNIIKRLLPQEITARWESAEPSHRSKRDLTSELLGVHVESDGEFIDNRKEYGSSKSSSNHSYEDNVDSDGISESMS